MPLISQAKQSQATDNAKFVAKLVRFLTGNIGRQIAINSLRNYRTYEEKKTVQ